MQYGDGSKVDSNTESAKLLNDGDQLCAFISTSGDFTGTWRDNENSQALDENGEIIPGLYCAGNLGGPFYGGADYPFHQTGLSLGRCYTFGMIAAKHAMGVLED